MDVSGETTITIIRRHKEQTLTVKLEDDDLMRAGDGLERGQVSGQRRLPCAF